MKLKLIGQVGMINFAEVLGSERVGVDSLSVLN